MPVTVAKELWSELKRYVNVVDREEAAETVVSVLIDNDISPEEIKSMFKSDSDIKRALSSYNHNVDEEDEDEGDDDGWGDDEDEYDD